MRDDNAALPVRKDGERKADRVDPERRRGVEGILLADQNGIVDLHFLRVREDLIAEVNRDADHLEALIAVLALQLLEQRYLAPARGAPRRPEIDDQRLVGPVLQRAWLVVDIRKGKDRQRVGES